MSSSNQPSSMRQLMSPMSLLMYAIFIILGFFLHRFIDSGSDKAITFKKLDWATAKSYVQGLPTRTANQPNWGQFVDISQSTIDSISAFVKMTPTHLVRVYLGIGNNQGYFFLSPIVDVSDNPTKEISYFLQSPINLPCPKYCDIQTTAMWK